MSSHCWVGVILSILSRHRVESFRVEGLNWGLGCRRLRFRVSGFQGVGLAPRHPGTRRTLHTEHAFTHGPKNLET